MEMRNILLLILVFCCFTNGFAETPIDITELYNEGSLAIENGDMANAVYNLELAHLLNPYDQEISNNLSIAKSKVAVDIVEIEQFFLSRWIDSAAGLLLPGSWKILTLVLLLLMITILYLRLIKGTSGLHTSYFTLGTLVGLAIITVWFGTHRHNSLYQGKYTVVMSKSVQGLKQGPDEVSKEVKAISDGVKLEILDQSGDWYKVSAMDKEQGWIKKKHVKKISIM